MDKKERSLQAYMTVEATFLMPMILGGIIFIIYLGFYLYNCCLLQQAAYTAALRGSLLEERSNSEIRQWTGEELDRLLEQRLLAWKEWGSHVEVSAAEVKVRVWAEGGIPFRGFLSSQIGFWEYETSADAKRLDPVFYIRTLRNIGNIIDHGQ